MKKLLPLILLSLLLASCSNENMGSITRCLSEYVQLSIPEDQSGTYLDQMPGEKTVLSYTLTHPDDPNIDDDWLSETFWIEIPSHIKEFDFNLGDDSTLRFYYTRSCFCSFNAFDFTKLHVSGVENLDGSWNISFNMTAEDAESGSQFSLRDNGTFDTCYSTGWCGTPSF